MYETCLPLLVASESFAGGLAGSSIRDALARRGINSEHSEHAADDDGICPWTNHWPNFDHTFCLEVIRDGPSTFSFEHAFESI